MTKRISSLCLTGFLAGCSFLGIQNNNASDANPLSFRKVELQGPAYRSITDFKFLPDSKEFLVVNRDGLVHHYRLKGESAEFIGEFAIEGVFNQGDCAANAIQLDPDFRENNFFYVAFCADIQSSTVMRYTFDREFFRNIPSSGKEILHVGDTLATKPQHAVNSMMFDASKAMLISIGEKGRPSNAQDQDGQLGKILRLVPSRNPDEGGYEIPADNPFVGMEDKDPLVYAYGLRNPWRTVMGRDGRYWIGDVGAAKFEEVNLLTEPGQNFGWPIAEGKCEKKCDGFTDPVVTYTHADDDPFILEDSLAKPDVSFRAMWVGIQYDPSVSDRYNGLLNDVLLFGDFYMGWIRGLSISAARPSGDSKRLAHFCTVVSMQQGPDGYVYAATLFSQSFRFNAAELTSEDDGGVWKIVLTGETEEIL